MICVTNCEICYKGKVVITRNIAALILLVKIRKFLTSNPITELWKLAMKEFLQGQANQTFSWSALR